VSTWTAHDVSLDASYELYKHRLLIFKVDEANYNASGCSIDKQLRLVKELEQKFDIELLNRLLVAYESNDEINVVKNNRIAELLENSIISADTLVFDNTITDAEDLKTNWKKPLGQTYLAKYLV
jgi:Lhr-like helicase